MKAKPTVVVLSGESGCGKTTLCVQVVSLARARGLVVAGLLTPPRVVDGRKAGMDVEDIRTGQCRPLADAPAESRPGIIGLADGPATEGWHFHAEGLAWGALVLRRATPCDVLVIDELGPLELVRGQGWIIGLDVLRGGHYRLALASVRPALLSRFREQLDGVEPIVLPVTRANQAVLAGQVMTLLGDDT